MVLPQNFKDERSATNRRNQSCALARGKIRLVAAHQENILSPVSSPGPALEDPNASPGWRYAIDLTSIKNETKENTG